MSESRSSEVEVDRTEKPGGSASQRRFGSVAARGGSSCFSGHGMETCPIPSHVAGDWGPISSERRRKRQYPVLVCRFTFVLSPSKTRLGRIEIITSSRITSSHAARNSSRAGNAAGKRDCTSKNGMQSKSNPCRRTDLEIRLST